MMKACLPGELAIIQKERIGRGSSPIPQRPVGVRGLLFASPARTGVLLSWSAAAVVVFYAGWACTAWATGKW
jgi:hypothetical protein